MKITLDSTSVGGMSIKHIAIDDTRFAYIEEGKGEPLVFVHGAVTDLRIWQAQIDFFSKDFRAISYSRRGHWPTAPPEVSGPYTRESHSEDLVKFLDSIGIRKVNLVGHSFGGAVALLTASKRPDLVRSLILGEPSPFPGVFDYSDVELLAKQKTGFDEARLLAKRGFLSGAVRKFLEVIVGADVLDQLPHASRAIVLENVHTLSPMLEHYYQSPAVDFEKLSDLSIRTLLITGEFSPKIAWRSNELLHSCLSHSEHAELRSVSHGLQIEDPSGFNRAVMKFLAMGSQVAA